MRRPVRFDGILISHLGNLDGRMPEKENTLAHIQNALDRGFHVCAQIVYRNGAFLLPCARGYELAKPAFLSSQRVWCCTDDPTAMDALCAINAHSFFITERLPSLTTAQFIWTLPPHKLASRSIAVFPEFVEQAWLEDEANDPAGICTNIPMNYC